MFRLRVFYSLDAADVCLGYERCTGLAVPLLIQPASAMRLFHPPGVASIDNALFSTLKELNRHHPGEWLKSPLF